MPPETPGPQVELSREEQAQVLANHVAYLEEEIAARKWSVELLAQDNAEIEFLGSLNAREWERNGFLYKSNNERIQQLEGEGEVMGNEVALYRKILEERYGEATS